MFTFEETYKHINIHEWDEENTWEISVSQADPKPEPIEMPVTFITCNV